MRRFICGMAVIAAGCLPLSGKAGAAPLTAAYAGITENTKTSFEAVFHYDSDDFVQDIDDPSLFNGTGGLQYATFTSGGLSFTFNSSSYFYERVVSGTIPDYEFGIRQDDGAFLYLKLNGATQEGNYALADGAGGDNLDPTKVTIVPGSPTVVSAVPIPPASVLFAGSLLAFGMAGYARARFRLSSIKTA